MISLLLLFIIKYFNIKFIIYIYCLNISNEFRGCNLIGKVPDF